MGACFYQLIPTLKPEYAVVLQRIESRAIVATDLGSTLNVIRVRLHRARRALKQILLTSCKDCCPEHGFMNCEGAHGGMPRGKVSLAYGHCNATSQISSYMHTCKERRSKASIIIAIERAFGSVTLPDDADGATASSVSPRLAGVEQEEEGHEIGEE